MVRADRAQKSRHENQIFSLKQLINFRRPKMLHTLRCHWVFLFVFLFLPACASSPKKEQSFTQSHINALVASGCFEEAVRAFETKQSAYGSQNELLYLLDKGYTFHLAGRYRESIEYFAQAQRKLDELYTKSVTNIASTWVVNDNRAPYRGEAFEYSLIHIFQALNYAALGNFEEALVEARDMDRRLNLIAQSAPPESKEAYRDDALGRLLCGILYETTHDRQDLNDAFISYKKSLKAYQSNFYKNTKTYIPRVLIENLLASAEYLGFRDEFETYRKQFSDIDFVWVASKMMKAEVYVVHYNGLSALKYPIQIPMGLPGPYLTQVSFPDYSPRQYEIEHSTVTATGERKNKVSAKTELTANLERMAIQTLNAQKAWLYTKGILRPAAKYAVERGLERRVSEQHGRGAGYAVQGLSSIYNLWSEQADLRAWQTLPAQIRISRFILFPGKYSFEIQLQDEDGEVVSTQALGDLELKSGEKKFLIVRTVQ